MSLRTLLREPLLHYLVVGAVLFAAWRWLGGAAGTTGSRIVLTQGQVDHLAVTFTKTWQRPPTDAELKGLTDDWVREEIAVREAMAAGLDRDDTIIRRRLRQKLEFLLEDMVEASAPTESELEGWLAAHAETFRTEPQVAFRQVYLSRDRRGDTAESEARAILAELVAAGPDARIDRRGDPLLLPQEVELTSRGEVARMFGQDFSDRVEGVAPRSWTGPIESGYGLHLVLVRERRDGSLPELALIRPQVERAVLAERRTRALAAMYEGLLGKYQVVTGRTQAATNAEGAASGGR